MQLTYHQVFCSLFFSLCPLFPQACRIKVSLLNCSLLQLLHLSLQKSVPSLPFTSTSLESRLCVARMYGSLSRCGDTITNFNSCPQRGKLSHFLPEPFTFSCPANVVASMQLRSQMQKSPHTAGGCTAVSAMALQTGLAKYC